MRVAIIGNCQVESFAVAAEHMLDGPEISIFDYSQTYSRSEEDRRRYVLGLHSTDYVFAQTATFSHTSEHDLREVLGDRLVTIANFYFRGLFPDTCYIGDFHARLEKPSTLHSVIVLDGFRRGLSEEAVCDRFRSITLDELGLGEAWASSLVEMRAREAGGVLDVPVGDLMEEACRRYPAFLTMNHPSGRLVTQYFSKVLDHLGVSHRLPAEGTYPDALARHDMLPIYDFVAERHELSYRTGQSWKVNSLGGAVSREDYVAACYQAYAKQDPASLLIHSPTDMVASLRASPYRYLVEPDMTESTRNFRLPMVGRRSRDRRFSTALTHSLHPVQASIVEVSAFVHDASAAAQRARSEAEAIGPKLEHLASHLENDARRRATADIKAGEDIVASLHSLRDRVDGLHRLVRLALFLTILPVLAELARLLFARR